MLGTLNESQIRNGVSRGKFQLFQRRVRARIFGEPVYATELVPDGPHRIAHSAWNRMLSAAKDDGINTGVLQIHSAYRSVAWQRHIFDYWVEERRKERDEEGLASLSLKELHTLQTPWTAAPGTSAHHTGFALDLKLYELGKRDSKKHPAYTWLANHARTFGFYPYFPEGWHWEYNPPGLIPQIIALRNALRDGKPFEHLLEAPKEIPLAVAAR
jgi:hypothetical protein